jgi:hypothetical protein
MGINLPMHHPPRPGQTATINPVDVALFARSDLPVDSIVIANGVNVFEGASSAAWSVVANAGTAQIVLNLGVNTGAVWSVGNVAFPPGSSALIVHGQLRTQGSANEAAGQVSVPTIEGTAIDRQVTTITATFPVLAGSNFSLNPGDPPQTISPGAITDIFVNGSTLTINPGSYGGLNVNGGAVILLPGSYTFTNVTFNNGAELRSNGVAAIIRVNVRNTLIFRGTCTATTGGTTGYLTQNVRWAVFGSGGATLGPSTSPDSNVFRGSVVAMNGPFIIEDGSRTYSGGFFGLTVTVHGSATVRHTGFSATAWETPT